MYEIFVKIGNRGTFTHLSLGSPILIVVSVICRDQCIYYLYYVLYINYIRLAAKITEKHTSHEIQHKYTKKT